MRLPKTGDIWLVHYPYVTPGNMEKIRPAIIKDIDEDTDLLTIQKLTTKKHKYNKQFKHPKLKKTTYITNEKVKINDYNLIRYIGNIYQK